MQRLAILVLVLAVSGYATALTGQRQGGAAPGGAPAGGQTQAGRQGGAPAGRQGGLARPVRDRAPETGTALIRGRVVMADTGTPVRRAEVQATTAGQRPRGALTDTDGAFEFRDLPAGNWGLRASKTGFVALQFGQRSAFGPSEPIQLSDGQQFTAQFALPRAGAITGRVFDEYGDPVANVRVGALRVQWTPTGRRLSAAGATVVTDDTGTYRVYGLAPGRYYVSATITTQMAVNGSLTTADGPITYSAVYFPGTTDLSTAVPVEVGVAQEQSNINVGLTPARAVRVSGVVLGVNGTPIQATVRLQGPGLDEIVGLGGRSAGSQADGTFTLAGVAPGTYTLDVMTRVRSANVPPEVASVPMTVGTDDISGLTITTTLGGSIYGTIATDTGERIPLGGIRVTAPPMRAAQRAWMPRAQATDTGTFELEGLIGAHSLRVDQLPSGWMVKSVTANGVDVSDLALEFRGTEQVSARVVLTNRVGVLAGSVRSDDARARGASVVIFPDDAAKWTVVSRFLRTARVGESGQFTVSGLPPHQRYFAIAIEYMETGEYLNPEFLQMLKPLATSFSLAEGEQQTIELPLVARQ